jgi:hypothetical protein
MNLTKTQQLLIRACKSLEPKKRLISVYKRFYYRHASEQEMTVFLIGILSKIINEFGISDILDVIQELNPNSIKNKMFNKNYVYEEVVLQYMISKIRLTEASKIEGFWVPLRFRK